MSPLSDKPFLIAYHDSAADSGRMDAWQARLQPFLPGIKLVPLASDAAEQAMAACVWAPPIGRLAALPHLKGVISLGQGVDHILRDDSLPEAMPIVRLVDPDMAQALGHWVTLAVLSKIRKAADYRALAQRQSFRPLPQTEASEVKIGLYGVGAIGGEVARQLQSLGLDVTGYVTQPRSDSSIRLLHGQAGLDEMLSSMDIHICVMPLTADNRGFFDKERFSQMKIGAYIINAGRGAHIIEDDLLASIHAGHLSGACLDVFHTEPLPDDHAFWQSPHIEIWPHVAAQTNPRTASEQIANAILAFEEGRDANNLVDRVRGY